MDTSLSSTSIKPNITRQGEPSVEPSPLSITSSTLKIIVSNNVSDDEFKRFENAIFDTIAHHSRFYQSNQLTNLQSKSIIDNITSSTKINIKYVLQLVEEIINPIYLHKGEIKNTDNPRSLFVDGLAPDIAWRLQMLLDNWHKRDPTLFPRSVVQIYNLRLKYVVPGISHLFNFFKDWLHFDNILSLKDIFNQIEREELSSDCLSISMFKNHIEIYLKKQFHELHKVTFNKPKGLNKTGYNFLQSNHITLETITAIVKPKFLKIMDAILTKAKEAGYDVEMSKQLFEKINTNFCISPIIRNSEYTNFSSQIETLFLRKIQSISLPTEQEISKIKTDLDVLHYIRSLADSNISLEELLTGQTTFVHQNEFFSENDGSTDHFYNLAISSGKPLIQTRYFIHNSEKFYLKTLDLSRIRLIEQPNMEILSKLSYLKTLILNNNRPSANFDITRMQMGKLEALENLWIRNCGIKLLPKSMFEGCLKLQKVVATGNAIREIEKNCFEGTSITEFHIDENISTSKDIEDLLERARSNYKKHQTQLMESLFTID